MVCVVEPREKERPGRIGIFHGSALLEGAFGSQRPSTLGKVGFLEYSIGLLAALSRQNRRFVRRSICSESDREREGVRANEEGEARHGFCIMHSLLC